MPPLPTFFGAAIIDSINPCAFGVLIFLLSYLIKTVKRREQMIINGLMYIAGVFLTYLIAGLALLPLIGTLGSFSTTAYAVIGVIVIIFGLLEIKDFFWYGKGPSLTLLPGASERIKLYVNHISASVWSAFSLGVFVALVELPCTGAVYLAILSMMSLAGASVDAAFWLVVYNIIFVLPLIIILLMFYKGLTAEQLEAWRKKHRGLMRLTIGSLLIIMGVWMLMSAI